MARREAGVLPECQSGPGRLQAGHEDGRQRHERAFQTQADSCYPRTGESYTLTRLFEAKAYLAFWMTHNI